MKVIEMHEKLKTVSLYDIQMLEAQLGCTLPPLYTDFLLFNNGGRPVNNIFRKCIHEETHLVFIEICVDIFMGFNQDVSYDLYRNSILFSDRIPSSLLPIAHDSIGNLICIGVDSDNHGKIFIWYDLDRSLEEEPSFRDVKFLTSDLREFLDCMGAEENRFQSSFLMKKSEW
jgi:hypothetical protein